MKERIENLKSWYEERERKFSAFFLLFGFVFDSFTLNRIDSLIDNLWLGANLLVIGICLIFINRSENIGEEGNWKRFWFFNILQFSFGALLGASFIFYFRSAALAVSWPFLLILLVALVGNEIWKKHYERLVLQLSFLYLSLFVFATFLLPVIIRKMGVLVFLGSGILSLVLFRLFIIILNRFAKEKFKQSWKKIWIAIGAIFLGMNLLYFTNLIPPIPLSLKDAGIYHNVEKLAGGNYRVLEEEEKGIMRYFDWRPEVHLIPGNTLFAYSAIFSPADLDTGIVHEWQHYDEAKDEWVTASRIPLRLSGGRAEGYRTFSSKTLLPEGKWRVNVTTSRGQVIGRINFEIISAQNMPIIRAVVKD
ncbi:MAG: hypothetical protein A2758_02760 [Candidatus Zambryskibacteria bacterium RIFCSPHIGHO2_01_FULL_49_18]|uniref:DUF2914 domain-containing protein n=2 Tax=Candidatus Zambryskiibacteriota TaxID=1817925 RepID=A0A1G2T242_9BACT|nr:MAG: hypothetical protein A2758_02760 [Candidatus Zambryskibacteria bacterium RIFCSPHIGHO2_01_FULL_49_18]OHB04996.1 MAG: hypothetical protein A3A26_00255 [Candidatus Zambryskibacteria bacterium RIFCSPLOWO2_01_FULL_47_14]